MTQIPVSGLILDIDPSLIPPGPQGPPGMPGGPILRITDSTLQNNISTTITNTQLFIGNLINVVNSNVELFVTVSGCTELYRAYEALAGDVAVQERIDIGSGLTPWQTVGVLRNFMSLSGSGASSVAFRQAHSLHFKRGVRLGLKSVQYGLISSSLSSNPSATLALFAGATIRVIEVLP